MKEWDNIILDQSRKGSDHPTFGNADIIFRIKEACKVQIWKKKRFVKIVTSLFTVL